MDETTLVFVYGTLKKGFYNHRVLEQAKGVFRGDHVTPAEYTMLNLGSYPGVISRGSTKIKGEVYEVANLTFLDYLEGYPHYYNRILVETRWGPAWMYTINDQWVGDKPVINSGKW